MRRLFIFFQFCRLLTIGVKLVYPRERNVYDNCLIESNGKAGTHMLDYKCMILYMGALESE